MRLEQEVRARQQAQEGGDWRDVRNQYSNENALDEHGQVDDTYRGEELRFDYKDK